jgi:MFS superfamily sulfate permease-like transporter
LIVNVTSTISLLTASTLAAIHSDDPATTAASLALIVGGLLIGAGLLRFGFLAQFISKPVLIGFKIGAGLLIASSQLGKILGVSLDGTSFWSNITSALEQLDAAKGPTVALALGSVAAIFVLRSWAPRLPATLSNYRSLATHLAAGRWCRLGLSQVGVVVRWS